MLAAMLMTAHAAWQPASFASRPMQGMSVPATSPIVMYANPVITETVASVQNVATLAASHPNCVLAGACVLFVYTNMVRSTGVFQTRTKAPSYRGVEKLGKFGWLQADMRVPLPSFAELENACHRIGNQDGREVYLCATAPSVRCQENAVFSEYYKQPVYICDQYSSSS